MDNLRWSIERSFDLIKSYTTISLAVVAAIGVWSRGQPELLHQLAAIFAASSTLSGLILLFWLTYKILDESKSLAPDDAPSQGEAVVKLFGLVFTIQSFGLLGSVLCLVIGFFLICVRFCKVQFFLLLH